MEKRKWKFSKGSLRVYCSIFLTYLLLAAAVAAVLLVGMYRSYQIIQRDAAQLGESKLDIVTTQFSNELVRYMQLCDVLAGNGAIKEYAKLPPHQTAELGMRAYYLQKEIVNANTSLTVDGLMIYFPQNHSLVTPSQRYDAQTMDWLLSGYEGASARWLDSLLEDGGTYGMHVLGRGQSWLTRKVYSNQRAVALIIIDYDLPQLLDRASGESGLVLLGTQDALVYATDPAMEQAQYRESLAAATDSGSFAWQGKHYIAAFKKLPFSDWTALVGVPLEDFAGGMHTFRLFAGWLLFGGAVVALALSFVLSRRAYTPLDNLLRVLSDNTGDNTFQKVMDSAKKNLIALKRENEDIRSEMERLSPIVLGKMLLRLADADAASARGIAEYSLSVAGLAPTDAYLAFGVWYLEDADNFFGNEENHVLEDKRTGLAYFMLYNVLSDLLFERLPGTVAHMGDYYIVLCACREEADRALAAQAVERLTGFYRETLGVTLAVTKPVPGAGAAALQGACRQVFEEMDYWMFWHSAAQGDAPGDAKPFSSYLKYVRNLIRCLDAQNYKEAYATVELILDDGLPKGTKNLRSAIYRTYGMIGMLVSAIDEQTEKDRQFLESLHYEERLYNVKDVVSFRTETQKILTELIAYKQTSQDVVVPRLVQDVEQYLAGHYMENDVSVSSVAAQFHISESYLSRLFKTYLKCNGLEYIQRLRIEKAKELLKTASIKDTARQVGFWDTQALIRVFKKYEGITPGKYKELWELEQKNEHAPAK